MSTTNSNRMVQPYLFFNGSCEQAVEDRFGVGWMINVAPPGQK